MRSFIILFLALISFNQQSTCQTKAKITDVDFHLEDRYIVVNYNLVGSLPKEEMTIEMKFITESGESVIPKTVTGDAGTKIFGDGQKAILWDIVTDSPVLAGNLKASVTITSSKILYKGSGYAFLSILIPGLGGYSVDNSKARSVITTVGTIGLIAYGLVQKSQADEYYADYKASNKVSDMDKLYTQANGAQNKYFIATRAGAGLWALDILWVTFKGIHNRNEAKNAYKAFNTDGVKLYHVNNGLQIGYSVTF